jgi:hypothetical protein
MRHEYPKAMHGKGQYAIVRDSEAEAALRSEGWVDGHEYWSAQVKKTKVKKNAQD